MLIFGGGAGRERETFCTSRLQQGRLLKHFLNNSKEIRATASVPPFAITLMTDNKAPPDVILNGTVHIHLTYLSPGQVVINFYFLGLILMALDRQTGIYFTMNSFCQQFQLLALSPPLPVLLELSISSTFEKLWPLVPIKDSFLRFPNQRP